jgi:hypothetical protein
MCNDHRFKAEQSAIRPPQSFLVLAISQLVVIGLFPAKVDACLLPKPMKIVSFNIDNINRRLANLLNWLREAEPDIVCLQEIKAADTEFSAQANPAGGISCGMPRREALEWRGDSCDGLRL